MSTVVRPSATSRAVAVKKRARVNEEKSCSKGVPGVTTKRADPVHARAQLARREILAFVEYPHGEVWTVEAEGDLHQRTRRLNEIVDLYKVRGRIFRASTDHLPSLLPFHEDVGALVVFPRRDLAAPS